VPKLVLPVVLLAALMMPVATNAECVTVTVPPSKEPLEPLAKPALIFSGTVTTVYPDRYLVSFQVDRVWAGQLRRETTFFVAPVVEGAQASSFTLAPATWSRFTETFTSSTLKTRPPALCQPAP
jgi:hypothetical protein